MPVRWSTPARADRRRQMRHIAGDSPTAARDVAACVRAAIGGLATHPLMGRPGRVIDTRELVVPRTPFAVAYRVSAQTVEIVSVVHQAHQWHEGFDVDGESLPSQ